MHYNVIVTADVKQSVANAGALDAPSEVKKLLSEMFSSNTKIVSEGTLSSSRNGRINLIFKGSLHRENKISFSKKEPDLIALTRGETILQEAVTVFLEEGTRRRCIGKGIDGEHIEFTVRTMKVENRLLKSGKMILEYAIDVCGVCAEMTRMSISVIRNDFEENLPEGLAKKD